MSCHICGEEAVDRCYTCGQLFCVEHGKVNCIRCESAITAGDNRADRVSTTRMRAEASGRPAWWRAQQAEDYEPPSCHVCHGLARRVCTNCQQHFCGEHAGPAGLCRECGRSSLMGIWCMLGGLALMACMIFWGFFAEAMGPLSPDQRQLLGMYVLVVSCFAAVYLVLSISCMNLFRKAGRPGWIAFVPIWNKVVLLQLAGKPTWWLLLYLLVLPILAVQVLVGVGLAKNFGKSADFGVGIGMLPIVFLPLLARSDPVYAPVAEPGRKSREQP